MAAPGRHRELEGKTFLVCVGAMKAATSWLYAQLRATPTVAVSPLKEVHFFDARFPGNVIIDSDGLAMRRLSFHIGQPGDPVDNLRRRPAFQASVDRVRMIYDDDAYFDHFASLAGVDTRVLADITPAYAVIGASGFEFMRRYFLERNVSVKILFVMRDPVQRLWSHIRFFPQLRSGADPLRDWPDLMHDPATMARSDYRRTITDLERVFDPGDIQYLFYEDLFGAGFAALCERLGIARREANAALRYNETPLRAELPASAAQAFRRALDEQYRFCSDRFAGALPASWLARDRPK